ncbi:MAG TPA: hypothetical protein VK168_02115 [Saprospiraceae bacterium]|nr:hypothetical protein [Saprospiraceae bacterium]
MKQVFLMLVFWAGMVHMVFAGYDIDILPMNLNGEYECKIKVTGGTTWRLGDRITWIFPDGQFAQGVNTSTGNIYSDHSYFWKPYQSLPSSPEIHAFIAKKGGAGIPPALVEQTTESFSGTGPTVQINPAPFNIASNQQWLVGNTWNFTPGQYTFLLITFRNDPVCTFGGGHNFTITLPAKISKVGQFLFNNATEDTSNPLKFHTNSTTNEHKHILLKLFVDNTYQVGQNITIKVESNTCLTTDSIYSYDIKRDPHDPNEKTVSIKRICDSKYAKTLRYRVQFHNDGKAPVNKVEVWDQLVSQLDPSSFNIIQPPTINGLSMPFSPPPPSMNPFKKLEFSGPGLPGLGQTDVIHVYSQTIYAYEFEVTTRPGFTGDIHNYAVVTFFDSAGNPLDPIPTNIETVYYGCDKPSFCKCLRSLFRPKKERPKP